MFCSECGKQVADNARFCGECGTAQATDISEQQSNTQKKAVPDNQYKHQALSSNNTRNNHLEVPTNHSTDSSKTQFTTILKAAAVIGGCIWGLYIIVGWIAYSQLQDDIYGIAQSMKSAAFTALIIQSFLASMLLFFGFKK